MKANHINEKLEIKKAFHGQGNLACCSPWGRKESDMAERLS